MDYVAAVEQHFAIRLRHVTRDEYVGPCPFCGGRDRFHVWNEVGNYWCRPGPGHCGRSGWVSDLIGEAPLSPEARRILALERKQAELERKQAEMEARLSALERMARSSDHLRYHFDLSEEHIERWRSEGFEPHTLDHFLIGYCERCPTDAEGRPSYTFPVFYGNTLVNIRHRLIGATRDKYRPHMGSLGLQLYNVNAAKEAKDFIIIAEGEKKAMMLWQQGFPAVAIMGKNAWKPSWSKMLEHIKKIYVCLDPDAIDSAHRLSIILGERSRVVSLPVKADDFFSIYGGTKDDFRRFLLYARR